MMIPRMIATDLDGTLLRSGGTVSERMRRALLAAQDMGIEVVFVTARPPRYVDAIAEAVGCVGTAVCSNGAIVYDVAERRATAVNALALDGARKLVVALQAVLSGLTFAVETGRHVICEVAYHDGRDAHGEVQTRVPTLEDVLREAAPIVKLLAWSGAQDAHVMWEVARQAVAGEAEVTHSGGRGLLEISASGVTKAATLAGICALRGVTPAEVWAFGDMPNDLPILEWAGTAYAMANAHPAVLAAVEHRAPSNNEDGVAQVLEGLFTVAGTHGEGML
ncbi:HAD family hydrolase [Planomonospora sp. ID82291]|uniref:HAD family hydrolase n=1 Tax=Planomonospora sp. ID82291 TaxID=2738136 RepID=UPI0018C3BAAD|nr:HAD family hydrolase [Planomonospora sp. ID82291]